MFEWLEIDPTVHSEAAAAGTTVPSGPEHGAEPIIDGAEIWSPGGHELAPLPEIHGAEVRFGYID